MQKSRCGHLREVASLFTRLGFTAFGGPAAHLAMMEDEVVGKRNWIDRTHFLDLVGMTNFIPGPNSTELAIHLGYLRAGWKGLIVGGVCFITPAVLIVLPIAWMYVTYGDVPDVRRWLVGINACVIGIIASALWRFGQTAVKDPFTAIVTIGALAAGFVLQHHAAWQPELIILGTSALAGALWYNRRRIAATPMLSVTFLFDPDFIRLSLLFLKIGATLFGSGYLLVSYLQSGVVEQYGWMTRDQLLTAITVGQVTPGPLLTTATFVGYFVGHVTFEGGIAGGIIGAILATVMIFLPSFAFVAILARAMHHLRQNSAARGALDGVNAAVVALIFVVTFGLARSALVDPISILIAIATLVILLRWNVNATWLVLAAGVVGGLWHGLT